MSIGKVITIWLRALPIKPIDPNVDPIVRKITAKVESTAAKLLYKKNTDKKISNNINGSTIGISACTIFGLIYSW